MLALAACGTNDGGTTPSASEETGTLLQRWSIEGASDPAKCAQFGAARMRVVVYDDQGAVQATQFEDCGAFEMRLELLARPYQGNATFVGPAGDVVSETRAIDSFIVAAGAEIVRNVDFAAGAMHPPSP